ncbi:hypothetical protein KUTeg_019033 [Tegillarca granosa]|uniref:Uncharacterized protein n=1 Tax=Tegillarca granosa TaxID=220873 RepID=A0ABQ9EGD1_TEGGR|nr:hypothetical protein KUTeg_019033 [Tegillarca granosa]
MVHISKEQLESWILDYGCKYKYHKVVKALAQRTVGQLNVFNTPHIRLVTCAFHRIITESDIDNFDTAVEQLDFIFKSCPEIIPFKLYSKLACGLKIKVLLDKLKKGDKYVLLKLNQYFPRTGTDFPALSVILSTDLHKLCSQSDHSPDIVVETLLEVSQGKTDLTEQNVLDLLTMISPVCTQDKLETNHQIFTQSTDVDSCSGKLGSESLFSSDNSDLNSRLNQSHNMSEDISSVTRNTLNEICTKAGDKTKESVSTTDSKEVTIRQDRGDNSRTDKRKTQSSEESLISSEESVSLFALHKTRVKFGNKVTDENKDKTIPSQQAHLQKEALDFCNEETDISLTVMETDEEQHFNSSNMDDMIPPSRMEDLMYDHNIIYVL